MCITSRSARPLSHCKTGSQCSVSSSFFITQHGQRRLCASMCSEQLCWNKSIQIEVCSSFTLTNWDLISKTLAHLLYTKKPAGRGCNCWRGLGWKANLGDTYVLRVPLGLPWVGRIWQEICTATESFTLLEHGKLSPDKDSLLNTLPFLFSSAFLSPSLYTGRRKLPVVSLDKPKQPSP